MKHHIIIVFYLFCFSSSVYTQDSTIIKNNYEKDTLKGRHFGNYIKPKNGIEETNPEFEIDRDPTFRKCKNIASSEERRKCFSKIFYGHLRKKIKHDNALVEKSTVEMVVQFTISKTGEIKNIIFLKSNDKTGEYEKEMIKIINKLPPLEPGIKNGKPVDIPFSFPIKFS